MSGLIYAVDAGSAKSAFVLFDPALQRIVDLGIDTNESLLKQILLCPPRIAVFAYEKIASFGFPVGKEVLDTAEWNGRFRQAAERTNGVRVYGATRKEVVVHHTGKATGGDKEVRAAMIARFGKENLASCKYDLWSSLAIAACVADRLQKEAAGA